MDCDLHRIIQSKQPLNDMHYKCFAKQMLEGIRAMHDIGVFRKYPICSSLSLLISSALQIVILSQEIFSSVKIAN